jgi:hypothetical protein
MANRSAAKARSHNSEHQSRARIESGVKFATANPSCGGPLDSMNVAVVVKIDIRLRLGAAVLRHFSIPDVSPFPRHSSFVICIGVYSC